MKLYEKCIILNKIVIAYKISKASPTHISLSEKMKEEGRDHSAQNRNVAKELIVEYLDESTIHGMRYIGARPFKEK